MPDGKSRFRIAALLGRYPDEIEARKALIRQKAPMYAYKKAVKSVFLSMISRKLVKSTSTGEESDALLKGQQLVIDAGGRLINTEKGEQ